MFRASFEIPGWQILSGIGGVCSCCSCASISILGWQISRPTQNLYFEMAILIGKSRPRVNIIIWETSAGAAAAHKTASAELKKHKGSREEMSPGLGGIRLVFLPGLDGTWEGGATDERGAGRVRWGGEH